MENSASRMWRFGQSDYNVLIDVENATLTVKVEETLSADAWQGSFESKRQLCNWLLIELRYLLMTKFILDLCF